ncbi:MAG: CHAT domain-containing protein [Leptolyngbya sp. DLM2.Bin15]|nr:MAG: CHAT domain-containing protein [Leptolyngbya sp. DLM2.Bin15]
MSLNSYRSNVERLKKEKANLERDLAKERSKLSSLQSSISSITRSITRNTTPSTLRSKTRQIDSKRKEVSQCQKKAADLEIKISRKLADLNQNLKKLEKAEEYELKKQEVESKKRRGEEIRHAITLTRETERQVQLQNQLRGSRFIIDLTRLPESIKVLFVASNPTDQPQLRLDEEIRSITEKIRASEHRDSVQLVSRWAARPADILQALNEHKPHIVHFSGHGLDNGELVFQSDDGSTKLVSQDAIVATMSTLNDNIRAVIFNACFSSAQAESITQYIDVAIGMRDSIHDDAARVFAAQFYSAIGFGRSIKQAFDQGVAALLLEGIPEEDIPALFTHEGVDPEDIILVRPAMEFSGLSHPNTTLEQTYEHL